MKIRGYKSQNHIFAIKKLFAEIIPADCKYILKNNSITITLIKKENKSWSQIHFKEDKVKKYLFSLQLTIKKMKKIPEQVLWE